MARDTVSVSLLGISDLLDEADQMGINITSVSNEALQEAAQPILEEAQKTSAFADRTGKLRKSLTVSKVKMGLGSGGTRSHRYILVGSFADDVQYAKDVEYGHGGDTFAPAHPFLEPAFNHHRDEAEALIAAKLREALNSG